MTTGDVLKEEQDASQPEDKAKRQRSTILFPYQDLADAISVAKGVHTLGGSSCDIDQLAAKLGHTVTSGSFQQRLNTARIFGLLTSSKGKVTLTALGTRIVDSQQERSAKVESFLNVPLYKKVYDHFKGASLPPPSGLDAMLVSFGVAPKQKETARRAFNRSAAQAGFFEIAQDRLTSPSLKGSGEPLPSGNEEGQSDADGKKKGTNSGDGGNGTRHPLIDGLIKALPAGGEDWPLESRKKWLQAAAMNFAFVYTDSKRDSTEDQESLKVSIEHEGSAK